MKEDEKMIKIKTVYIYGYGKLESYSNGQQTIYLNNGKESTREELNDIYKQYKNKRITTKEVEKEVLLENLYKSIDSYTNYIEDYKQQKQAEKHNRIIRNIIDKIENM